MNNVSNETVMVVCHADANHCNICGAFFAEGDNVCEGRHFIGQTYPVHISRPPVEKRPAVVPKAKAETNLVVCHADANHCNICGAFFAEGDNVCEGRHFIGQSYPVHIHA